MKIVHKPVLLNECLDFLKPERENALLVDGTLGEGGHSYAFLNAYPDLNVIGIDADAAIQKKAEERLAEFGGRMSFFLGWSDEFFKNYPCGRKPDLILLDLGISVYHYVQSGRGFSFCAEEPLDMRLSQALKTDAASIVNNYGEKQLADLIYEYGEERFSRKIASAIVRQREDKKFETAKELAGCIFNAVPKNYRYGHLHPATKTFQALRIAVNCELERLPVLLRSAFEILEDNGKLGVISFHSLEDRIVKLYFKELGKNCICPPNMPICKCGGRSKAEILTKKAVFPSDAEVAENSPSRSARLRVIRKINGSL